MKNTLNKMVLVAASLGALFLVGCGTTKPEMYDHVRNETVYTSPDCGLSLTKSPGSTIFNNLGVTLIKTVQHDTNSEEYMLRLASYSEGFGYIEFSDGEAMTVLVDGRIRADFNARNGSVNKQHLPYGVLLAGRSESIVYGPLNEQVIHDMARAESIEFSVRLANGSLVQGYLNSRNLSKLTKFVNEYFYR